MILKRGDRDSNVSEIQLALAGFRGTVPDGDFGPGTELQVRAFQELYMKSKYQDGIVGPATLRAIIEFSDHYSQNWDRLSCPCGTCSGFGQGLFHGKFREGKGKVEKYYLYEYPGIHKLTLWKAKALKFYGIVEGIDIFESSGYRCSIRASQTGRSSTNHRGKAIDLDNLNSTGNRAKDKKLSNRIRSLGVEFANCQIGWYGANKGSLEPSSIAPTWVHVDSRRFTEKYKSDNFFVKSDEELIIGVKNLK